MASEMPFAQPPDCEELFRSITEIAKTLRGLQELGVTEYAPVVEHIIATRSRDAQYIQRTLDGILDFACHPDGLILFKSLCRHYYTIDPNATADYVHIYREMCDSEESEVRT